VGDVLKLTSGGMRLKDAVAEIAEQNSVSKSVLYQLALDAK
jgi:16S rRNA C1402 (ribose-2'-O) methylase RsmI